MKLHDAGTGPALLLLHGMCVDDWTAVAESLRARYRVLVPELPGYGSSPPSLAITMEERGDELAAAVAAAGVPRLHGVAGFSTGAYRAFDLVLRHRPEVQVVVSVGGYAHVDDATRAEREQLATELDADPALLQSEWLREQLAHLMLSPAWRDAHPDALAQMLRWPAAIDARALATEFHALARAPDLRAGLARFAGHVVARVGERDLAAPVALSIAVAAAAADGEVVVVPGAGHALLIEDAEGTGAALGAAFDRLRARGSD